MRELWCDADKMQYITTTMGEVASGIALRQVGYKDDAGENIVWYVDLNKGELESAAWEEALLWLDERIRE